MLTVLKEITKQLPHPLLMRSYHYWHVREHRASTTRAAEQSGIPMLDQLDLSAVKTSDTIFILGSGPSINGISPERWTQIAKHDSVGFNFWPFHPFVPRMYFFESIPYDLTDPGRESEVYRIVRRMLTDRAEAYKNTLKVITDVRLTENRQLIYEVPEAFRRNLYAAYTVPAVARTPAELAIGIRYLCTNDALFTGHSNRLALQVLRVSFDHDRACGPDAISAHRTVRNRYGQAGLFLPRSKIIPAHLAAGICPAYQSPSNRRRSALDGPHAGSRRQPDERSAQACRN